MELSFINPWLLPALALAVLPLLVHLHARASARRVDFPAAVLLLDSGEEITRLRRLRELLTLLARMMLVAAFVLCAARPVVKGAHRTRPAREALACAIILDDSASMLARGPGGTRLACAKAVARAVVAHLEAGSELLVVTFSGRRFGPSPDIREGLEWADAVEAGFLARGPEKALAQARAFAEGSNLRAEVHLLSDFEWLGTAKAPEIPRAALILSVLDERDPDGAVLGVKCPDRRVYPGVPFTLGVELRLEGEYPEVALELGGRERTAPAEDARFRLVVDEPGVHVGKVTLRSDAPDALKWDDSFHLVLNVCRPPRVACYGQDAEPIRRALRPGAGAPVLAKPFVAADGPDGDCAFVTSPVPRETWSALERASVPAVVLGPALDGAAPCPSALLPFGAAGLRSFEEPASLVLASPVPRCLEIFLDGRNGDLSSAAFALGTLARPRGADEGALFSREGRPALLLWEEGAAFLGGISPPWSELSTHPAFVPFVHELVAHACGLPAPISAARPGEPLEPPASLRARSVRLPGGGAALLGESPAAADRPGPCVFFGDRGEWGAGVNCVDEIPGLTRGGGELAALFRAREVHVSRGREELLAAMARARAGVELRWLPFLVAGLFLLASALSTPRRRGR